MEIQINNNIYLSFMLEGKYDKDWLKIRQDSDEIYIDSKEEVEELIAALIVIKERFNE